MQVSNSYYQDTRCFYFIIVLCCIYATQDRVEKPMKKLDMLVGNGHHMQYIEAGMCVCTITIYMYV